MLQHLRQAANLLCLAGEVNEKICKWSLHRHDRRGNQTTASTGTN